MLVFKGETKLVPHLVALRVPMIVDSVLLVDKLLFVGEKCEGVFFVVGEDFDKCFTLGQPDKLWKEDDGKSQHHLAMECGHSIISRLKWSFKILVYCILGWQPFQLAN